MNAKEGETLKSGPASSNVSEDRVGRNIGVGCFTFFIGATSGAMTGVFAGKAFGFFSRCEPQQGLPACDWWWFAFAGGVLGAVSLPILALWRLRRADRRTDLAAQPPSTRG